jgi:hypothetical protein
MAYARFDPVTHNAEDLERGSFAPKALKSVSAILMGERFAP